MEVKKESFLTKYVNFINNCIENKKKSVYLYNDSGSYIYLPEKKVKNPKKSVLIVIHELSRTGAPIVALDTARVLKKNNYFVTIIALKDGPLSSEFKNENIPIIIMPKLGYTQYSRIEYQYFFDDLDIDAFVLNFDKVIMITATLYNLIKRFFNIKKQIIWWIHEGWETYNILNDKMPKSITPNIKVICGGKYSLIQLNKYDYNYSPTVLNYGIEDFVNPKNIDYELVDNKINFMIAGTIGTRKGQDLLLKAIIDLDSKLREKAKFIFVGEPAPGDITGEEIKKEIIEYKNKNKNIEIISNIPRKELYEMYKKIDVLIVASTDDPMPVVATECCMFGKTVICSNMVGTSYYIKNKKNGYVYNYADYEGLSDIIAYIIKNKNTIKNTNRESRKIFENNFEMSVFEKNMLELLGDNVNE